VKPGDKLMVAIVGRDPEGYYELSRGNVARPRDWPALEQAFAEKLIVVGKVTEVIKGGLSCRRDGKVGGAGNPLPHYQARCSG
jgi:small subunit ribosomal protein S1